MNWNTLEARLADRARARACAGPLLDLIIPTEDWPRCGCKAGQTTLTRRKREADQIWWWCSVCNLPVRRAGKG